MEDLTEWQQDVVKALFNVDGAYFTPKKTLSFYRWFCDAVVSGAFPGGAERWSALLNHLHEQYIISTQS